VRCGSDRSFSGAPIWFLMPTVRSALQDEWTSTLITYFDGWLHQYGTVHLLFDGVHTRMNSPRVRRSYPSVLMKRAGGTLRISFFLSFFLMKFILSLISYIMRTIKFIEVNETTHGKARKNWYINCMSSNLLLLGGSSVLYVIYLSIYLSVCPPVCPSVGLSIYLSVFSVCIYLCVCLWLYNPCALWPLFQFLNLYTVGRTPRTGDQPVTKPLPTRRTTQTQNKSHRHPCLE
jgi:hypothetical protein